MSRGVNLDILSVIPKLIKIFKEQQFDIVQYATPNAALYASIAAKIAKIHNRLYTQWGIRYMGYNRGLKRSIFKWVERLICQNSTAIECESFSLFDFSLSQGLYDRRKASVIGKGSACGIDFKKFDIKKREYWRKIVRERFNIPNKAVVYGYMGRLTRDKGINELIASFRVFLNSHKDAYLMLVGSYDNVQTIDFHLLNWAQHSSHVIFPGRTSVSEQFYSAMDVFCSLSYREGFGIVVIEAEAMGVPAIVTNVPGQIDTIQEDITGISVPAKEIEPVVKAMSYFYEDATRIINMGLKASQYALDNYEERELFTKLAQHRDYLLKQNNS